MVDMGCICLDPGCTVSDCGGTVSGAMPIYKSVQQPQDIKLSGNVYYRREGPARYVNRSGLVGRGRGAHAGWMLTNAGGWPCLCPGLLTILPLALPRRTMPGGYDGRFSGWATAIGEVNSKEVDPKLAAGNLAPVAGGPAAAGAAAVAGIGEDFFSAARPAGAAAVGALNAGSTGVLKRP